MKFFKDKSLLIFGYVILCFGALSSVGDFFEITHLSYPIRLGVVLADGAFIIIGLVTTAVAARLDELEKRLKTAESQINAQ